MPMIPISFAGKVDRLFRPARGEKQLSLEGLLAREKGRERRGQHAAAGDQELRVDDLPFVGGNRPALCRFVEMRASDCRVELDVLAQVEAVGDIVHPALDFRLAREFLAPAPALVEILGKQILVDIAFRVEARAGIPVPVPGSADIGCSVERLHVQSLAAQKVQLVKTRDARPDHGRIELQGRFGAGCGPFGCGGFGHRFISHGFRLAFGASDRDFSPLRQFVTNHVAPIGVLNGG